MPGPAVVFDVLARLLRHVYGEDSLVYARNVTDVDDKIIEAARGRGRRARRHHRALRALLPRGHGRARRRACPTIAPHATGHIGEMVAMIARLIETGNAYEADGHVLFHVPSDPDYGALGRRDREAMIAGARVEVASYKKDPADFVLWKPSPEGVIGWDIALGPRPPGLAHRMLGDDRGASRARRSTSTAAASTSIFPHHENEIAQSRCAHDGAPLARYWVHNGFLSMAGAEKMSKSLGNVVTVGELLEQDAQGRDSAAGAAHGPLPPAARMVRRSWSPRARRRSTGLYRRIERIEGWQAAESIRAVLEALADDLNTPLRSGRPAGDQGRRGA